MDRAGWGGRGTDGPGAYAWPWGLDCGVGAGMGLFGGEEKKVCARGRGGGVSLEPLFQTLPPFRAHVTGTPDEPPGRFGGGGP